VSRERLGEVISCDLELDPDSSRIVFDGRVVLHGETVILETSKTFFVVPLRKHPLLRADSPAHEEKCCRICFGTEEEGLFSPCKCDGTMKFVHLACLNEWRARAAETAYYRCEQCGYSYNLRRTDLANVLEKLSDENMINFSSFLLVLMTVIASNESIRHLSRETFEYLKSFSPAFGFAALSDLYPGFMIVGSFGGVIYVKSYLEGFWALRHHINPVNFFWENPNVLMIGSFFASSSTIHHVRLLNALGLLFCVFQFGSEIKGFTKRLLQRFGHEFLLDVAT